MFCGGVEFVDDSFMKLVGLGPQDLGASSAGSMWTEWQQKHGLTVGSVHDFMEN